MPGFWNNPQVKQSIVTLDMEGVLTPEIWIAVAEKTKIPELRRTTREPLAMTFHSYAYALARREFVLAGDEPPRLLSAPEQLLEVRRMLRGEAADGARNWPERLRPALATRGFAEELRDVVMRAAERGLDGKALRQLGRRYGRDDWMASGGFIDRYSARFDLARKRRVGAEMALVLSGKWPRACVNPTVLEKSKLERWQPFSMERGPGN